MKYYLSSYKFGNETEKLKQLIPSNNKIGCINNARDFTWRDSAIADKHQNEEMVVLNQLGFEADHRLAIHFPLQRCARVSCSPLEIVRGSCARGKRIFGSRHIVGLKKASPRSVQGQLQVQ